MPFVTDPNAAERAVRLVIDHDFSDLIGRRSVITYKATLPPSDGPAVRRWLALVIDGGWKPGEQERLPLAHSADRCSGASGSGCGSTTATP